mgnify:CR=1 FL=1
MSSISRVFQVRSGKVVLDIIIWVLSYEDSPIYKIGVKISAQIVVIFMEIGDRHFIVIVGPLP